jgi:hypothetical protein
MVSPTVKKFAAFYGTRKFINVFTRTLHLSTSEARSIQFTPNNLSKIYFNIIFASTTRLSTCFLEPRFPQQNPVCISVFTTHAKYPYHSTVLDHQINTALEMQVIKLLLYNADHCVVQKCIVGAEQNRKVATAWCDT